MERLPAGRRMISKSFAERRLSDFRYIRIRPVSAIRSRVHKRLLSAAQQTNNIPNFPIHRSLLHRLTYHAFRNGGASSERLPMRHPVK